MTGRFAWVRQMIGSSDRVLALAALLTSVVAVGVAWDEARVVRQAYRTAFSPILEVTLDYDLAEEQARGDAPRVNAMTFGVRNVGPGVAEIRNARLRSAGTDVRDWPAMREAVLGEGIGMAFGRFHASRAPGFLKSDEDKQLMRLTWPDRQRENIPLRQHKAGAWGAQRKALGVEICYCSLFEECWIAALDRTRPDPVRACPERADPFAAIEDSYRNPA